MGKEAIIDKIIADAEIAAKGTVEEAETRADEMVAAVVEDCKAYIYKADVERDRTVKDIASRRKTVAELDVKKIVLGKKKAIIDSAFDGAKAKLEKLSKAEYLKIIEGMLAYAADGDTVTVAAGDEETITKKFVEDFAKKKGIKLAYEGGGSFKKGIVLSGKGIDKNLTFEVELKLLRDEIETEVAKMIFGE